MPGIGSLFLLANHGIPESFQLRQVQDHLVFTVATAFLLGFAFLPTTLTALATGFFFWLDRFPRIFPRLFACQCDRLYVGEGTKC